LHGTELSGQGWHLFLRSKGSRAGGTDKLCLSVMRLSLFFALTDKQSLSVPPESLRKRSQPCPMFGWPHEMYLQAHATTFERYQQFSFLKWMAFFCDFFKKLSCYPFTCRP
jgi:hypothetical protein